MRTRSLLAVALLSLILSACDASPPAAGASSGATAQGELARARDDVQARPNYGTFTALGLLQYRAGDMAGAERSFREALRISPKAPSAYNNLCSAYNGLKRWSDAIEACRRAVALEPDFRLAKNNLQVALESAREERARIANLERRADRERADWDLRIRIGMMYYDQADYARAIAQWKKVPRSSPRWAIARNNIASAAILAKDWKAARTAIRQALSVEPGNPLYVNNLKWLERAQADAEARARSLAASKGGP